MLPKQIPAELISQAIFYIKSKDRHTKLAASAFVV
jgi:hypothetical protein